MKNYIIILLLLLGTGRIFAQTGAGSFETSNGLEQLSADTYKFVYSESLYLGPNANWQIEGEVHVYSRNIWISPTAKISGSGTLYIHSPSTNPFHEGWATSATRIDGNDGQFIDVNIVLTNPDGIQLTDMEVGDYAGTSGQGARSAALKIGKSVDLRVDGASIYLNGYDLELSASGQLLNYNRLRMVVTGDELTGHMIKNYVGVDAFFFPVGVEQGDYTPAKLTPQTASSRLHVSVNTYTAVPDLNITDETIGMDRVWNIFADRAMQMDYTLTHNMQTNGMAYVDADARIMQNADGGNWIGDVTTLESEGVHTREDIESRATNTLSGTWFTKFGQSGPRAVDDQRTMEYGHDITINVLENDENGSSAIVPGSVRIISQPLNGRVTVNVDGSVTYTPNEGFLGDDVFEYEITDENGLTSRAKVMVTVMPRDLFIPNVITPNGDGKNDRFVIVGREAYDRIEVTIMNRWGNEVYRNDDYKDEWDGRGLNEGTYFPIIRAIKGNQSRVFKSHVLIKRN
ncbi:T9SS type B sorting domain-containing protein [Sphingobacterium wenxiniae]|uniref:Gliding motility-associated C-terminal domain-containing protein n=1 Tax=Sphingobacterium wenxiniae TaxID=683125 RepID=A0A1I6VVA3_9SPHI|nr:gliding motility-associated C-terminal domain-containing protein [Sphingobacterium wenxiniae]SFT17638.1 gliding motility-associated C-terminal domain-containing protein [Sphingobacterium wenxiniae]